MNISLVSANDVMEHFAFPGNIDFAADDQGSFSCIIHERLLRLFIVCETMFTIGESRTISNANDTQAQQVALNPRRRRFSTKLLWSENADLKFSVNNEGEDVNKKPRSRENNKTTRARRTEEQGIGISEALWSRYAYITLNNVSNLCISGPLSNETPKQ